MDALCAAVSGMLARFFCHPLDTIKTVSFTGFSGECRVHGGRDICSPSSLRHSAQSIWRREGLTGFYRGVGVATLGSAPGVALYLTTYASVSGYLKSLPEHHKWVDLYKPPTGVLNLMSGAVAEAVSCVVWVPIDVTKERLQSQPPSQLGRYSGSWDAVRTIVRYEGLRGLYKGYWTTIASWAPYSAVYFLFYEYLLIFFHEYLPFETFFSALFAGGIGNIVASTLTNPLEFIKTRLQVQRAVLAVGGQPMTVHGFHYRYTGLVDGVRSVLRDEGLRALWRGVGSRVAYTAPNAALTMAIYSWLQARWIRAS